MKRKPEFVLQFDPSDIDALAKRYGPEQDVEAFDAGRRIAEGNFDCDTLKIIVSWKSARRAALIDENSDSEVIAALKIATAPETSESSAIETLDRLHGVGIPLASAILTAVNPEKYTVLDYRALESLGVEKWTDSVAFYISYLIACRDLAREHRKTLRTLDRALWQWSKERSRAKKCIH